VPSRLRGIGPEVTLRVASRVQAARRRLGWSRPRLSRELARRGQDMSPATLLSLERGVTEAGIRRVRMTSVDEFSAIVQALGMTPAEVLEALGIPEQKEADDDKS